jgi:ribosomal protein L37AE/L43A
MASPTPTIDPHLTDPFFHALWVKVVPIAVAAIFIGFALRFLHDWLEGKFLGGIARWRDKRRAQKLELKQSDPPHCPVCNQLMVERQAKRGANAGHRFWGCSAYPQCRGIRELG